LIEPVHALGPEQPHSLFSKSASDGLEVAPIVKYGCGAKRVQEVFRPVSARVEHAAAVVVAESWWNARL